MKKHVIIAYLLFPLTIWYGIVVWVRNMLFDLGVLPQRSPGITTIGIGNLSAGGTGKTPHVAYILSLLSNKYHTAMVSRGYRRQSRGCQIDDGTHSALLLGDEPAMIARRFPSTHVAVSNRRAEAIDRIRKEYPETQVIVLDDIMQYRFVAPTITIMLTDYNNLFYEDHIIPFGTLREGRSGKKRASIIVVTKCPEHIDPITMHNIVDSIHARTYQRVFFSYMRYGALTPASAEVPPIEGAIDHIVCFTGIANAAPLVEHLSATAPVSHIAFADHHNYTKHNLEQIADAYAKLPEGHNIVVTTQKDMARLLDNPHYSLLSQLPLYTIDIEVAFHNTTSFPIDAMLLNLVQENVHMMKLTR